MLDKILYIAPSEDAWSEPLIDELTRKMTATLRAATPSPWFMGYHTCACGSHSKAHNFILPDGLITNSLCVHYLAWHRNEVPREELEKIAKLTSGKADPDASELAPPRAINRSRRRHPPLRR